MNLLETLGLNLFSAFLSVAIKNPASVEKERAILIRVYNDLGIILAGLGMQVTIGTDPTTIINVPVATPAPEPAPAPTVVQEQVAGPALAPAAPVPTVAEKAATEASAAPAPQPGDAAHRPIPEVL